MYLKTERLIIRDFLPDDISDLQEIFGDPETMQFCEAPYDLARTTSFLQEFCIRRRGAVGVALRNSGKLIGYILLHSLEADVYEIGWWINRQFWRHGYAYEACCAVINHTFLQLHAHKIFAETVDNIGSTALMKKLGMQQEGIQRLQTRDLKGKWCDLHLYGILADEWTSR